MAGVIENEHTSHRKVLSQFVWERCTNMCQIKKPFWNKVKKDIDEKPQGQVLGQTFDTPQPFPLEMTDV